MNKEMEETHECCIVMPCGSGYGAGKGKELKVNIS